MKFQSILLLFCMIAFSCITFAEPRRDARDNATETQQDPQVVYVPIPVNAQTGKPEEVDPIEADKKLDQQLFNHFISILGNFGKILLNPEDRQSATINAAHMIDGIISVAHTLTRTYRSPKGLNRIVASFIRYLQEQDALRKRIAKKRACARS